MRSIPFYKPNIGQEEIDEVTDCLRSGWLTTGPKTKRFEEEFARYLKCAHAIALNSCTAALHLALDAVGVKAGHRVVVPTMTFAATAEVVRYFNAFPLFVDIRDEDLNLDVEDAERRIEQALERGDTVSAIIPVHYGGQIGDMKGIRSLAAKYGLRIVEDAAHCCPAYYRDTSDSPWKPVGSEADVTCFSFYANKTITTGEGGMACTDVADYAERIRLMSLHGISRDAWKRYTNEGNWYYEILAPGFKYNLTDIAASIGLHQLAKADRLHARRTELAGLYSDLLSDVAEIRTPKVMPDRIHSWHLYPIRLENGFTESDRAHVITELKRYGIGTSVHWMPLHMHPYYRMHFGFKATEYPTAAGVYPRLISLPLYPDLTEADVHYVSDSIKSILAGMESATRGAELSAAT